MPNIFNEEKIPETSLRDFFYFFFRHKWKAILFFLTVMVIITLGTFMTPRIYQSEAKLLVRLGRENVTLDPTATTGPFISVQQLWENEVKTELEILKSRELVEKVVDAIGPLEILKGPEKIIKKDDTMTTTPYNIIREIKQKISLASDGLMRPLKGLSNPLSPRDRAILEVAENLEIEVLKNSNIISISFKATDQKIAQEVIDKLISFFLDKHISVRRTAGSFEFFTDQTDQFRNTLTQIEENFKELKNKTGIASLDEQRRILLNRIGDLHKEIEATESTLAASRARIQEMEMTLSNLPETQVTQETTGNTNQGADLMRSKLYELQLKEQDLLSRYTDNSQMVKEIRRQIAEAKTLLSKEEPTRTQVTKGLNEAHRQVNLALITEKATFSSLQAKIKKQLTQLTSARAELKNINESEIKLAQMQREMMIQDANYRKYLDKLEQARIDNALEIEKISNISVVQAPTYPVKPILPREMLNMALGLFLGIFGGIGLAFFSDFIDHTFKKPEDIEKRLKLPTLASILNLKKNMAFD